MTVDAPDPPPAKRSGHLWLDLTVSIAALVTSAVSIFMASQNGDAMQRLVHANSWPFLQMEDGNGNDAGQALLYLSVTNEGTGPARVHSFSVTYDGHRLPMDSSFTVSMLEHANLNVHGRYAITTTSNFVSRRFLAPRQSVIAWQWHRTTENAPVWDALDLARRQGHIAMQACYCSVFNECWMAETNRFPPRPVESCPTDPPPRT